MTPSRSVAVLTGTLLVVSGLIAPAWADEPSAFERTVGVSLGDNLQGAIEKLGRQSCQVSNLPGQAVHLECARRVVVAGVEFSALLVNSRGATVDDIRLASDRQTSRSSSACRKVRKDAVALLKGRGWHVPTEGGPQTVVKHDDGRIFRAGCLRSTVVFSLQDSEGVPNPFR